MSHVIVLESWVEGTGRLLPKVLKSLGHQYTFITRNLSHYSSGATEHEIISHAEEVIVTETNDFHSLKKTIAAKLEQNHYDGIITICDYYIPMVSLIAQEFSLPQAFSGNAYNECNKAYVRHQIERAGLNNAKFAAVTSHHAAIEAADSIGYPLVVKPSDLASSAFVKLVNDPQELAAAITDIHNFDVNFREQKRDKVCLLEERLIGPEYSVEAYTFNGKTTVIGVTDKSLTGFPYFIEDGHMFPANIPSDLEEDIIAYVKDVLHAVGHDHGISHTEVKVTDDGIKLIEVNPRPGGNFIAELIGLVTNIDILELHINFALGKSPDVTQLNRQGSAAVKFIVPERAGYISKIQIPQDYDEKQIHRFSVKDVAGQSINKSIDNACYLGHVITKDADGQKAREYAESFVENTLIQFREV